jgi:hypothetical protein
MTACARRAVYQFEQSGSVPHYLAGGRNAAAIPNNQCFDRERQRVGSRVRYLASSVRINLRQLIIQYCVLMYPFVLELLAISRDTSVNLNALGGGTAGHDGGASVY